MLAEGTEINAILLEMQERQIGRIIRAKPAEEISKLPLVPIDSYLAVVAVFLLKKKHFVYLLNVHFKILSARRAPRRTHVRHPARYLMVLAQRRIV